MVESCRILSSRRPGFRVSTMGDWISGAFRRWMQEKIRAYSLADRFTFHGLTHGTEKWRIMSRSHVLVLPSLRQGQPPVILYAYAMGLPVVATKVGAVPDTLDHGENGFLVAPGSYEDLADKMQRLMSDFAMRRRMSENNLALYRRRFTRDRFVRTKTAWLRSCAEGTLKPCGQIFSCPEPMETTEISNETIDTATENG